MKPEHAELCEQLEEVAHGLNTYERQAAAAIRTLSAEVDSSEQEHQTALKMFAEENRQLKARAEAAEGERDRLRAYLGYRHYRKWGSGFCLWGVLDEAIKRNHLADSMVELEEWFSNETRAAQSRKAALSPATEAQS